MQHKHARAKRARCNRLGLGALHLRTPSQALRATHHTHLHYLPIACGWTVTLAPQQTRRGIGWATGNAMQRLIRANNLTTP